MAGIHLAFFVDLGGYEPIADSDNGHWHNEANDKLDDPSGCQHAQGHLTPGLEVENTVCISCSITYCSHKDENLQDQNYCKNPGYNDHV